MPDDDLTPADVLAAQLARAMAAQRDAGPAFDPPPDPEPEDPLVARRAAWADAIPPRFADARLDTLDLSPTTTALTAWCQSEARANLVLVGPVGSGKTWAAAAAARCRFGQGQSVAWWPVVDLLRALRPGGAPDAAAYARDVDVLVLDDLAAHRATDWTDEQLHGLVDHRWSHLLPIIATTNADVANTGDAMDPRLHSRLFGSGAVVLEFRGYDRRTTT